jgi:enterochelin esterase-like enzyme
MRFNLFSQNLALITCLLASGLIVYLYMVRIRKWNRKRMLRVFIPAVLASIILNIIAVIIFSGDLLPPLFIDLLPLTVSVAFLVVHIKWESKLYVQILSSVTVFICLIFGCLLINDYFQYYPNLNSLLNLTHYESLNKANNQLVTVHFSPDDNTKHTINLENQFKSLKSLPKQGKVYSVNIPGTVSNFKARTSYVYVPPIAFSSIKISLPVVVLLPGVPGQTNDWLGGGGAVQTLNSFAEHHNGIAPLVVFADDTGSTFNDTECVNSPRGNVETYLTTDVPNYIRTHFNVAPTAAGWSIGGLSMGGMCGIMLTLLHPDVYNYFLDFGGEVGPLIGPTAYTTSTLFGGSNLAFQDHQPGYLLTHKTYNNIGGFFSDGSSDSANVLSGLSQLYDQSKQDHMDVISETIEGQHTFAVWKQSFSDALPWLSNRLGATSCNSECY